MSQNIDFEKALYDCPQLVDSNYCLDCQGCCRFPQSESRWRPFWSPQELASLKNYAPSFVDRLWQGPVINQDGLITTKTCDDEHTCRFLKKKGHICRIYKQRPWECQLYPVLIESYQHQIWVSLHLACPYVLEKQNHEELDVFIQSIKEYFCQEKVLAVIRDNPSIVATYDGHDDEIQRLFTLQVEKDDHDQIKLLRDRPRFEKLLAQIKSPLATRTFVHLFLWSSHFHYEWQNIAGYVVVKVVHDLGDFLFWPPMVSSLDDKDWNKIQSWMLSSNHDVQVWRIENLHLSECEKMPFANKKIVRRGYDYIYERQAIAEYKGQIYKSQRWDDNRNRKRYRWRWESYQEQHQATCQAIFDRWMQYKLNKSGVSDYERLLLEENQSVHQMIFQYYRALGLIGRVLFMDNQLAGYTFGMALNKDMFCVVAEIADPVWPGLGRSLFRLFMSDEIVKKFRWINAMDDADLPKLRNDKNAYSPVFVTPFYGVKIPKDAL